MTNIRAEVTLRWADNDYLFALKVKEIDELQRVTAKHVVGMLMAAGMPQSVVAKWAIDASGIGAIHNRLFDGTFLVSDIRESLRLGLIGGGISAIRAMQLVETYVDGKPLASLADLQMMAGGAPPDSTSNFATAFCVLRAAMIGIEELFQAKKPQPATANGTDTSTLRASTKAGEPSSEPLQTSAT